MIAARALAARPDNARRITNGGRTPTDTGDASFDVVILDGCRVVKYGRLVVSLGLQLDRAKVEELVETLGRNGVTSNYRTTLRPTPGNWFRD